MSVLDEQFADWYEIAQVEVSEERFKARRSGTSAVAKAAKTGDLELIVRLAHGRPVSEDADEEALERFRTPFVEYDESFGRGKKRELSVLAGAALAAIITGPGRLVPLAAALAVESAAFARWKSPIPLVGYAGERLAADAVSVRKSVRAPRASVKASTAPLDALAAVEAPVEPADHTALVEAVKDALTQTAESVDEALQQQAQRAKVLDEELDFFWWLQNAGCRTVGELWSSLPDKAPALLAAIEAAEITAFQPGPRAAGDYINQVIAKSGRDPSKARSVSTVVKESRSWLRDYNFEIPAGTGALLPLHSCMDAIREMKFKSAWVDLVDTSIEFKATAKRSDSAIALQAYSECILLELL